MPSFGSFPNTAGKMCTSGTVAKIIPIVGSTMLDYNQIWGAGIGLDLNNGGGDAGAVKGTYNATAAGVLGIAFDIDTVPLATLRVEFPNATATNAAFWGGDNQASPVKAGHNEIKWADVKGPFYDTDRAGLRSQDDLLDSVPRADHRHRRGAVQLLHQQSLGDRPQSAVMRVNKRRWSGPAALAAAGALFAACAASPPAAPAGAGGSPGEAGAGMGGSGAGGDTMGLKLGTGGPYTLPKGLGELHADHGAGRDRVDLGGLHHLEERVPDHQRRRPGGKPARAAPDQLERHRVRGNRLRNAGGGLHERPADVRFALEVRSASTSTPRG